MGKVEVIKYSGGNGKRNVRILKWVFGFGGECSGKWKFVRVEMVMFGFW